MFKVPIPSADLRRWVIPALALTAMAFVSGCQGTGDQRAAQGAAGPAPAPAPAIAAAPPVPVAPRVPRVGLLLPLSGPQAPLGEAMLKAAEIAFFDVADNDFVLLPRDTGGTPAGAARAAEELIGQDVGLILGPLFAASVDAAAPIARARGVNIVSFSTNPNVAGAGVFVMGFLSSDQVQRVVDHAIANGMFRFGAFLPTSPYGQQVAGDLQFATDTRLAQLTRLEFYDPANFDKSDSARRFADYDNRRAQLQREKARLRAQGDAISQQTLARLANAETWGDYPYDAVLLAAGGQELVSIAPLMPYFDVDPGAVQFMGTGLWDDPSIGREPSLIGGWYAAPDPAARAGFEQRYQAVFGAAPPRLATLAYDATALAAVLAKRPGGPDFSIAALTVPDGFNGVDGLFRFHPDGRGERALAVLRVGRDGPTLISPAPVSFVPLTN